MRFMRQPGSARRYYDSVRQEVISRRQALKRQGIFPESQAQRRAAAGLAPMRSARCDRGIVRGSHARVVPIGPVVGKVNVWQLPSGHTATVTPVDEPGWFSVLIDHVHVGFVQLLQGKRRQWQCTHCSQVRSRHQYGIVNHLLYQHRVLT